LELIIGLNARGRFLKAHPVVTQTCCSLGNNIRYCLLALLSIDCPQRFSEQLLHTPITIYKQTASRINIRTETHQKRVLYISGKNDAEKDSSFSTLKRNKMKVAWHVQLKIKTRMWADTQCAWPPCQI